MQGGWHHLVVLDRAAHGYLVSSSDGLHAWLSSPAATYLVAKLLASITEQENE
jgi:hypothetical protein